MAAILGSLWAGGVSDVHAVPIWFCMICDAVKLQRKMKMLENVMN